MDRVGGASTFLALETEPTPDTESGGESYLPLVRHSFIYKALSPDTSPKHARGGRSSYSHISCIYLLTVGMPRRLNFLHDHLLSNRYQKFISTILGVNCSEMGYTWISLLKWSPETLSQPVFDYSGLDKSIINAAKPEANLVRHVGGLTLH